jgi:hypothetical protein
VIKKYRPSNGTEGAIFESEWCEKCGLYYDPEEEVYCPVLGDVYFHDALSQKAKR